ncbi:ABC transporter permease [Umezawaea tangerina]|uniref:ABC-type nitrate/sulfonate/bicarbonate transport system permease component n=1 Tax=Umezawaea tangerina TaxID=84725 RepID=A0A2T0SJZ0_9PSEU|nr:ABC transporter permease [Umezawaea tangerina]PRY33721.1 ABC-type nitrate/sulfonate/bicarbonate transport system permease component [Umezawaea tangerina]
MTNFFKRWVVFVGLLVVWQVVTVYTDDPFFPPPSDIGEAAYKLWLSGPPDKLFLTDVVYDDVLDSLTRLLGGWAIAAVVGISIGIALGRSRTALEYTGPVLTFMRSIPPPALVPVFMLLFKIGSFMQLATIVFGILWPILLNTIDGARTVDATKVETSKVFRVPRVQWVLGVVLPSAAPKIFAGLRVSLSLSLVLMVVSELVGTDNGIGAQLLLAQREFDYANMWAGIVLLGVIGYVLNSLLLVAERRVLGWQPKQEHSKPAQLATV